MAAAAAATQSGQVQAPGLPPAVAAAAQRAHLQPPRAIPAAATHCGQPQPPALVSLGAATATQRGHPQPHLPTFPAADAQWGQAHLFPGPPTAAAAAQWGHAQLPPLPPAAAAAAQWAQPGTASVAGAVTPLAAVAAVKLSLFASDGEANDARSHGGRGLRSPLLHPHSPPEAGCGGEAPSAAAGKAPAGAAQVAKASPPAVGPSHATAVANVTATRTVNSTATPIARGATRRGGAMVTAAASATHWFGSRRYVRVDRGGCDASGSRMTIEEGRTKEQIGRAHV